MGVKILVDLDHHYLPSKMTFRLSSNPIEKIGTVLIYLIFDQGVRVEFKTLANC